MKSTLVFIIGILTLGPVLTPRAMAQTPPPQEMPVLVPDPLIPGKYKIACLGQGGRIYTYQMSTDGIVWTYLDLVKLGVAGTAIEYGFTPMAGGRSFFRLKYTVANTYTAGGDGDIDGDGISNQEEVSYFGTDPFVSDDTDGDGYLNADETIAGTDLSNSASKPFDPASPPPANRYVVPLSWWLENKFGDTIEALNARNQQNDITGFQARATALADGSFDLPYFSIQAAVNAAAAGDVIQVAPGTYEEAVDLSARNVKLISRRGGREETIIRPPGNADQGILFGAANTSATVVSGFSVTRPGNASGPAILCAGGATPLLQNLYLTQCRSGIQITGSSPVLANIVVSDCYGTGIGDAALSLGGSAIVGAVGCTIDSATTGGQVQVSGAAARLTMVNSIVTNSGASSRSGGQVQLVSGGFAGITYSSIRTGFTGIGNITSQNPADPAAAYFDTNAVSGGQRRLLRTCECVDQGNPAGITGYHYLTRLDSDGEARRQAFGIAISRASEADMGADEYVSRLRFGIKARRERGVIKNYSEVDEASDVAFLGTTPSGNARIGIINDETITNTNGTEFNELTFVEISPLTGEIALPLVNGVPTPAISSYPLNRTFNADGTIPGGAFLKDPEAIAYDPATKQVLVTTSMTKVNRFRDSENSTYDPQIDPPFSDYDPRRCAIASVTLDNNLTAVSKNYIDSRDGTWTSIGKDRRDMEAFATGTGSSDSAPPFDFIPAISPVKYDSPSGMIAQLRTQLEGNNSLTAKVRNTGVLIAISTAPKFGEPVNGVTYQPGSGLPYNLTNGLGGPPAATAGFVLAVPGTPASAAFPYWKLDTMPTAGLQVTGYQTAQNGAVTSLTAGTTYYLRAWAYDGAMNYGRGLDVSVKLTADTPIRVNEIQPTGPDWVEFFNPSGIPAVMNGMRFADESRSYVSFPDTPNVVTIPARGFYTMTASAGNASQTNFPFSLEKKDAVYLKSGGFINIAACSVNSPNVTLSSAVLPTGFGVGSQMLNALVIGISGTSVTLNANANTNGSSFQTFFSTVEVTDEIRYKGFSGLNGTAGRIYDGGPSGKDFSFSDQRFECLASYCKGTTGKHPTTNNTTNHTQVQGAAKVLQATRNHVTQSGFFLHYANLGEESAVWSYSPKQQDFHPINVEGLAFRSQSEIIVGLRSPLTNRTSGDAYAFVFNNNNNATLPSAGWVTPASGQPPVAGQQGAPRQLNLNGQGIRSIQWCPTIRNAADATGSPATGAYLIIGGAANGGPLKNETGREKFSLYRWDNVNSQPVRVVADLSTFAVRPEGVNIITLDADPATPLTVERRVIFVEDRYKAEGYDTQNGVHWPLSALNLQ